MRLLLLLCLFVAKLEAAPIRLVPVVEKGLRQPVDAQVAPGEPRKIYVVEQEGKIRVIENGKLAPGAFLDITAKVVSGGEMGLLGLAFHPKFVVNRRYFVNYTARVPKLTTIIEEYVAGKKEGKELLRFAQPFSNHNGGQIAFDGKGHLYIATGDGGSAADPQNNGQSTKTLLGKLLRIDVDNPAKGQPYGIPADNPFATKDGRPEIFAYGLRNPWRFSFDRETGALFTGDVGQYAWEEVNIVEKGGNYGWDSREGKHCFEPETGCQTKGLIDPIHEYGRGDGYSITGGYVYRGKALPALKGVYVYGDYGSGKIWGLTYDQKAKKTVKNELLIDTRHAISSFGEDTEGEILVVSHEGAIYRLAPGG